jgi:hypothetical protein
MIPIFYELLRNLLSMKWLLLTKYLNALPVSHPTILMNGNEGKLVCTSIYNTGYEQDKKNHVKKKMKQTESF